MNGHIYRIYCPPWAPCGLQDGGDLNSKMVGERRYDSNSKRMKKALRSLSFNRFKTTSQKQGFLAIQKRTPMKNCMAGYPCFVCQGLDFVAVFPV